MHIQKPIKCMIVIIISFNTTYRAAKYADRNCILYNIHTGNYYTQRNFLACKKDTISQIITNYYYGIIIIGGFSIRIIHDNVCR